MRLNGKNYTMRNLGEYNVIADLEAKGCDLSIVDNFRVKVTEKPLSALRSLIAVVCCITPEEAGKEIETFIKKGGTVQYLIHELDKEVDSYLKRYNIGVEKKITNKKKRLFRRK